jgi:hypothetical protein
LGEFRQRVLLPQGNGSAIAFSDAGKWIIGIINQQILGRFFLH